MNVACDYEAPMQMLTSEKNPPPGLQAQRCQGIKSDALATPFQVQNHVK